MLVILMCDSRLGTWVLGTARSLCYDALHSRAQAAVEGPHFAARHMQCASLIPSQRGRSLSGPNESLALFSQERKNKRMTHDQHPPSLTVFAHSSGKGDMSIPLDSLYAFDSVFPGWLVHGKSTPLIIKITLYNQL